MATARHHPCCATTDARKAVREATTPVAAAAAGSSSSSSSSNPLARRKGGREDCAPRSSLSRSPPHRPLVLSSLPSAPLVEFPLGYPPPAPSQPPLSTPRANSPVAPPPQQPRHLNNKYSLPGSIRHNTASRPTIPTTRASCNPEAHAAEPGQPGASLLVTAPCACFIELVEAVHAALRSASTGEDSLARVFFTSDRVVSHTRALLLSVLPGYSFFFRLPLPD